MYICIHNIYIYIYIYIHIHTYIHIHMNTGPSYCVHRVCRPLSGTGPKGGAHGGNPFLAYYHTCSYFIRLSYIYIYIFGSRTACSGKMESGSGVKKAREEIRPISLLTLSLLTLLDSNFPGTSLWA